MPLTLSPNYNEHIIEPFVKYLSNPIHHPILPKKSLVIILNNTIAKHASTGIVEHAACTKTKMPMEQNDTNGNEGAEVIITNDNIVEHAPTEITNRALPR